jgi:hypothetical protein
MNMYNIVHVLLSVLSYMFRCLLRHLQRDLLSYAQKKLQYLNADLHYTWIYNIICIYLKDHIWFN